MFRAWKDKGGDTRLEAKRSRVSVCVAGTRHPKHPAVNHTFPTPSWSSLLLLIASPANQRSVHRAWVVSSHRFLVLHPIFNYFITWTLFMFFMKNVDLYLKSSLFLGLLSCGAVIFVRSKHFLKRKYWFMTSYLNLKRVLCSANSIRWSSF